MREKIKKQYVPIIRSEAQSPLMVGSGNGKVHAGKEPQADQTRVDNQKPGVSVDTSKPDEKKIPPQTPWLRQKGLEDKNFYANVVHLLLSKDFWKSIKEQFEAEGVNKRDYLPTNTTLVGQRYLPSSRGLLSLSASELLIIAGTLGQYGVKLSKVYSVQRQDGSGSIFGCNLTFSEIGTFKLILDESISGRGRIRIKTADKMIDSKDAYRQRRMKAIEENMNRVAQKVKNLEESLRKLEETSDPLPVDSQPITANEPASALR